MGTAETGQANMEVPIRGAMRAPWEYWSLGMFGDILLFRLRAVLQI